MTDLAFPPEFVWGAATSAYQIEGSPLADGAGSSIWHRFVHTPGKIAGGDHGDVACDHYRSFRDDVILMRELGIQAYRFSIAWPRVLPHGTGAVNRCGIEFYERLVDTLLEHDIRPFATLYHWDLPAALEDRGGWAHRDAPQWFAEYSRLMFQTLGDRVPMWATINEPWVVTECGYVSGTHAPGRRDLGEAAAVAQNLLRAHAAAVEEYRSQWQGQIGLVVNLVPVEPTSDSSADRAAAERMDVYLNRQFLDPALLGQVPEGLPEMYDGGWPPLSDDQLQRLCPRTDFLGINYYLRLTVRDDPKGGPARASEVTQPNRPRTSLGWEIYPHGLVEILQWVRRRYGNLPLYIAENGAAFDDATAAGGTVHDAERIEYLRDHLQAARQAIAGGVDLRGYFVWSLLDNFEWSFGYGKRFGIVQVDYQTQRRTPKDSAQFYSQVIRSHGAALER